MSLLDDYARRCVVMVKRSVPDGAGGQNTSWAEGEEFLNRQALNTSMEAMRAEKEGVTSVYSGLIDKAVNLKYGDYFKDLTTEITYRVTTIPDEKASPASASFALKYFTAERKELPA